VTAVLLRGSGLAAEIRAKVLAASADLNRHGVDATLAVVVATDDESSHWYVRSIAAAAKKTGTACRIVDLGAVATEDQIGRQLDELSNDPSVHGIILQTPLPDGVSAAKLVGRVAPRKDVDGANPVSLGRLAVGESAFPPATARSVIELLDHHQIPLNGRHVAVVGRSNVVGKPLLHLLLQRDATVTICHSRSNPLAQYTRPADIIAVAVGRAGLLTADHVTTGAVVIDVGTNVMADNSLVGDADAASVASVASALSPVPGGVGSVTTALLLLHTVEAAADAHALAPA
jgi:methylenetetrahydrofolate dehydrogenase (NADP+) / methenyltetrahydrofolate cyclohydrolase